MSTVLAIVNLQAREVLGSGYEDVDQARVALRRFLGEGVTLATVPTWALVDIGTWIDVWMDGAADRYAAAPGPVRTERPPRDGLWGDPPLIWDTERRWPGSVEVSCGVPTTSDEQDWIGQTA